MLKSPPNILNTYQTRTFITFMLFMKMTSNYLTIHSSSETFLCHYEFNFGVMKFTPKTDNNLPIQNPPLGGLSNSKVLSLES